MCDEVGVTVVHDYKKVACALLCIGLGCIAGYLEVNGGNPGMLWIGVFFSFLGVVD